MSRTFELILGGIILGILVMFFNPTHLLMPDSVNQLLVLGLGVVFLVFVGMVWRERAGDEREERHIQKGGRASFLVGTATLVIGIGVQALNHEIDLWLLLALSSMVLTKLISRFYSDWKS